MNTVKKVRLNRFLADAGIGSRRECDTFIQRGEVSVNGYIIDQLGSSVDPFSDRVFYKKKEITKFLKKEYILFNKPTGILTAKKDPYKRNTIYTYLSLKGINADHLNYVGRLDKDSEGLLVLTNDGDLNFRLTHPKFGIKKVYHVRLERAITEQVQKLLRSKGVVSDGEVLTVSNIHRIHHKFSDTAEHWYEIDLLEGKNRHIRRIFENMGISIVRLIRVAYHTFSIENLKSGNYRYLTSNELKKCFDLLDPST